MEAYYSISDRTLTIYNKKSGLCIAILTDFDITMLRKKYGISDADLHITL